MTDSVRFDFTIDDLVDVGQRGLARSDVIKRTRRAAVIFVGLVIAGLVMTLVPVPIPIRIAIAVGAGAGVAIVYPSLRRSAVRERLRAVWRERLKSDGPFTCEVDLTSEGITIRQLSTTTSTPWSGIAAVTDAPDGVEILGKKGGLFVVRERAFASPEAKRAFIDRIRASLVS